MKEYEFKPEFGITSLAVFCESRRTRLVYDIYTPALALLFRHFIPCAAIRNKDLYFIVYSETMMRRLADAYKTVFYKVNDEEKLKVKNALDRAKIVKIGLEDNVPFGKLMRFIKAGDLNRVIDELALAVSDIVEDAVVFCYGLHLISEVHDVDGIENAVRILDSLGENATLINIVPGEIHRSRAFMILFDDLYDVTLKLMIETKQEEFDSNVFVLSVVRSYSPEIRGYMRIKLKPGYILERI